MKNRYKKFLGRRFPRTFLLSNFRRRSLLTSPIDRKSQFLCSKCQLDSQLLPSITGLCISLECPSQNFTLHPAFEPPPNGQWNFLESLWNFTSDLCVVIWIFWDANSGKKDWKIVKMNRNAHTKSQGWFSPIPIRPLYQFFYPNFRFSMKLPNQKPCSERWTCFMKPKLFVPKADMWLTSIFKVSMNFY